MKKTFYSLIAAAVLLASAGAFATPQNSNPCGNNGNNCNVGGSGGNGGNGGNGGAGGLGGQGGSGGTGYGGSATAGAAAAATANASNRNDIRNTNAQGQMQGQAQGQQQQIRNSGNSTNDNRSSATGGSVLGSGNSTATGGSVRDSGNSASVSGSFSGGNTQTNAGNNSSNAASGNSTSVAVAGDVYEAARIPVSTAYAPSISPTAVCALSMSGGAQGSMFGFSLGGSYIDKNCEHLEQVRRANEIGQKEVAAEMMMDIPAYAKAAQRIADRKAGKVSAAPAAPVAAAPVVSPGAQTARLLGIPAAPVAQAATGSDYDQRAYAANQRGESIDPIVRKNLGLPPL